MFDTPEHDDDQMVPGFVSADEVPDHLLDPHPAIEEEGDDSKLADSPGGLKERTLSASRPAGPLPNPSRARIVPLRRTLRRGMRGPDVIGTKRALNHAGLLARPKRWSRIAGPFWVRAVKKFQTNNKLKPTGVYDRPTHRLLVGQGHFDKYGAFLMAKAPRAGASSQARDKLEAAALYGYHNRQRISYTQSPARMSIVRKKVKFPWFQFTDWLWEDCSSFDTGCYYSAGLPDPNRNGYNGEGFTGTLAEHGHQTVKVQHGDLALYGPSPYRHVTMHVGTGIRCVSHGSDVGPLLVSTFRYRPDYNHSRSYV